MEASPETGVLQPLLGTPGDPQSNHTPVALTAGTSTTPDVDNRYPPPKEFSALRKVVEFQEMALGEMVVKCGLSSALRAMADAEVNPIVSDGDKLRIYAHYSHAMTPQK